MGLEIFRTNKKPINEYTNVDVVESNLRTSELVGHIGHMSLVDNLHVYEDQTNRRISVLDLDYKN